MGAQEQPTEIGGNGDAVEGCFHCGLPLPAGADFSTVIAGEHRAMCCAGCEAVARAIVDAGLEDYYRHRNALPENPRAAVPEFLRRLDLYDLPDVQRSFVREEGEHVREAALILEGITCAACIWLNERHLARLPGVLAIEINYATHRARVRWDDTRIRLSDILRAVAAIGYSAHPFDPGKRDEIQKRERSVMLRRLAIAGLGAMQVMMYAVPAYLAGDGEMSADIRNLLHWASLLLTVPVVFYSAAPFFRNAWRDLQRGGLGMDVPVSLGVGAAFVASVWATFSGSGQVYYDSVAMFVFLLLGGRYLEMVARSRAGDAAERLVKLVPATATRLPGFPPAMDGEEVGVSALRPGDHVLVKPGETIPADGRIARGSSDVDESLLTGESRPVKREAGAELIGGAVNLSGPLVVRVEKVGDDTVLAAVARLLDRALAEKPRMAQMADRAARWFVLGVLLVAAAAAIAWQAIDPSRTLWVAIAVLVVTCPCALSLATPVALTAATSRLTRLGLLVIRGHALETLARATDFVFDKTGTLTRGRMALLETAVLGNASADECRQLAARLEQGSEHPIGKALCAAAGPTPGASAVEELRHEPGGGVEGTIHGKRYRLGRPRFAAALAREPVPDAVFHLIERGDTVIALASADGWLAAFAVGDELRPEAAGVIRELRALGKRVHLLSGDAAETARRVASRVGIATVEAGVSPAGKLAYVRALQQRGAVVAMVGDGVNDAPVLAQAQVSIAMGEGTEVAQASADMVLLAGSLANLTEGLRLSRRAWNVIRENLAWALGYNLVALPLAVLGFVTPWIAAIGMSASSLLVVLNALRLTRQDRGSRFEDREGTASVALPPPSSVLSPRS